MQKYFFPPGKHTIFHQGHKGSKAKGLKVIKARGQEILKSIFLAYYSSVSPLHPILRHNVPNITEPMEIANCEKSLWILNQSQHMKIFWILQLDPYILVKMSLNESTLNKKCP